METQRQVLPDLLAGRWPSGSECPMFSKLVEPIRFSGREFLSVLTHLALRPVGTWHRGGVRSTGVCLAGRAALFAGSFIRKTWSFGSQ